MLPIAETNTTLLLFSNGDMIFSLQEIDSFFYFIFYLAYICFDVANGQVSPGTFWRTLRKCFFFLLFF